MSAFIGPIHYWLYDKVRIVGTREEYIYEKSIQLFGKAVKKLRAQVRQIYGGPLPEVDLSELIDPGNIHGWLQHKINTTEAREAAFLKELLNMNNRGAYDLVLDAFSEHGRIYSEKAKSQEKYDLNTAPGIYTALNDHYLNGMPCDQADKIIASLRNKIIWESRWMQEPNWERAGINDGTMPRFYQSWIKAFVEGTNSAFVFNCQTCDYATDNKRKRYEISKM